MGERNKGRNGVLQNGGDTGKSTVKNQLSDMLIEM